MRGAGSPNSDDDLKSEEERPNLEIPRRLISMTGKRNRFEGNNEIGLRLAELETWTKQPSGATL